MWQVTGCKNLLDFSVTYLACDVLLLLDAVENYRKTSLKNENLDPAHYLTVSSLSHDSLLRSTKVEITLISDYTLFLFFESAIRGGQSVVNYRTAESDHSFLNVRMGEDKKSELDVNRSFSWIEEHDMTNAYGAAMLKKLPTKVTWATKTQLEFVTSQIEDGLVNVSENDDEGYYVEVDLIILEDAKSSLRK